MGVARSLLHSVSGALPFRLRFDYRQRNAAIAEQVIGDDLLRRIIHGVTGEIDPAGSDAKLSIPLPSGMDEGRLNKLVAGLFFVPAHNDFSDIALSLSTRRANYYSSPYLSRRFE